MKLPHFVVKDIYNESPLFWRCFKNKQMVFSQLFIVSYVLQKLKFPPDV
jgi:hypothetical protein